MDKVDFQVADWASMSGAFDSLKDRVGDQNLANINEAQTRYEIIDKIIRDVLGWKDGQVSVEEYSKGVKKGYVDYLLRVGDSSILIEAKKIGAAFPSPTPKTKLKISGSVLGVGPIGDAIGQAEIYAKTKQVDLVCVTNGLCWCFYTLKNKDKDSYATILFPFSNSEHPKVLFDSISESSARSGSIGKMMNIEPVPEDRLISVLYDADGRLNRNTIADHILPALNEALYNDSLLTNAESLEKCFVSTDGRSKFDTQLGIHLADPRPSSVKPATRIKRGHSKGPIENLIERNQTDHAPPVTLIIGGVGAGKSTYLKHFELVSGRDLLERQKAHWIYIDFEQMGAAGNPRLFLYEKLRDYLLKIRPSSKTDYEDLVEAAYREKVEDLAKGPLSMVADDKQEFKRRVTDIIQDEFEKIEPYVDRLFSYIVKQKLCVVILDNVDLYEDENLENKVFSEGLALSKRLNCHIIMSLRDSTFVSHKNSSVFNAHELRKLWLDPPPFKSVLSKRLTYSRKILEKKSAKIMLDNGIQLQVPDLGVFFDIVQRSVLQGSAGDYIENMTDTNTRKGLDLITNFLTSGHVQADKALSKYISGEAKSYYFPFHEVFKGTALSQWKYFKEGRADCINIFDARNSVKKTRLLRLAILSHLAFRAQDQNTIEVGVDECIKLFAICGASEIDILRTLKSLQEHSLIATSFGGPIDASEKIVIRRSGGYYLKTLCRTFVYTEQCMFDTAIEDPGIWKELCELTTKIEQNISVLERMELREKRIIVFLKYLETLEENMLGNNDLTKNLYTMKRISNEVRKEAQHAVAQTKRYYN